MAPKKDKAKKEKKGVKEEEKEVLLEVDKTFYELQLADCNRKLARLRTLVDDLEVRNEELIQQYNKLDEDRADVITYLKKTLNQKTEENNELKEKVEALEELREIETQQFNQQIAELNRNFNIMREQLTSENKLLSGKLNSLEEFRAIRDDLMKKFEKQEQDFKDQEMFYKRQLYDAEKKFIIGKDKLKKEMEARLLQLAQDFQDATEIRIAASTHRVIRENIAINNELDSILSSQSKLAEQNEKFKEKERSARLALECAEQERDSAIEKSVVQLSIIEKLTEKYHEIKRNEALMDRQVYDVNLLNENLEKMTKENQKLIMQLRILEQNVHTSLLEKNEAVSNLSVTMAESKKLRAILDKTARAIKATLKLDAWNKEDPTRETFDRQTLLEQLLQIISSSRSSAYTDSMETLASVGIVYERGDLGFIPKSQIKIRETAKVASIVPKDAAQEVSEDEDIISDLGSLVTIPSMKILPPGSHESIIIERDESITGTVTPLTESDVSEEPKHEPSNTTVDTSTQKLKEISAMITKLSIKSGLKFEELDDEGEQVEAEQTEGQEIDESQVEDEQNAKDQALEGDSPAEKTSVHGKDDDKEISETGD